MRRHLLLGLVAAAAFRTRATDCYYPDGTTIEPNHVPCNKTIDSSSCCDPLDSCTTSGHCLGRTGFNYRGSCTDKTWESSNCDQICHDDPFDGNPYDRFTPMWPCNDPGASSTSYCCESLGRNCCTIATFNYGTSGAAFGAGLDQMMAELASFSALSAAAATATATVNASQQTSTNNSTLCAPKSTSTTTVGVAVGVPLGAISVGLLIFILWNQKKNTAMGGGQQRIPLDPSKPWSNSNTPLRTMPPQGYQLQNPNYPRNVAYPQPYPHPQPQSPPEPNPQIYSPPPGQYAYLQRHELGDKTPVAGHSPHSQQQYPPHRSKPFPDLGGPPGIHELI